MIEALRGKLHRVMGGYLCQGSGSTHPGVGRAAHSCAFRCVGTDRGGWGTGHLRVPEQGPEGTPSFLPVVLVLSWGLTEKLTR